MLNYIEYLENNETIPNKEKVKENMKEMVTNIYNGKDNYLSEQKGDIIKNNIHHSQNGNFYNICNLIEKIITC